MQLYCIQFSQDKDLTEFQTLISPQTDKWGNHREYRLTEPKEYIKGYTYSRCVKYKDYDVAVIAWCPRNANNDAKGCAIKLSNAVLYVADWHFILSDILVTLNWQAKNITRVDLCCDFNYFCKGLYPETFIRKYLMKKGDSYIREGSNRWACYGIKELHNVSFDSIRWGSRKSGVSVYLYNKSKELNEKKYKPYIVECWKQACLNVDKVWRVEISINSSGRGLKDSFSGLVRSLFVDELSIQENIEGIFKAYASRYFSFRRIVKGGPKRKKDMPGVALLDLGSSLDLKPTTLYYSAKSTRQETMVLRALHSLKLSIQESQDFGKMGLLYSLDDVISQYAQRSYLMHKCTNLGEDIKDRIEKGVESALSLNDMCTRMKCGQAIMSDKEYINDVTKRIAKKVAVLNLEGILS